MAKYRVVKDIPGDIYTKEYMFGNIENAKKWARNSPDGTKIDIRVRDGYTYEDRMVEGIGIRGDRAIIYKPHKVTKWKSISKYTVKKGKLFSNKKPNDWRPFGL